MDISFGIAYDLDLFNIEICNLLWDSFRYL